MADDLGCDAMYPAEHACLQTKKHLLDPHHTLLQREREGRLKAEGERDHLQDLLFEEVLHDHDCYGHDGREPEYDEAWLLFWTAYGDGRGGEYTELGAKVKARSEAERERGT